MWWLVLLLPLVPEREVPIMQRFEVVYPVEGRVLSFTFRDEVSPFLMLQAHTNTNGLVFSLTHVSVSNIVVPPLEVVTLWQGKTNRLQFDSWVLRVVPTNTTISHLHPLADIYPLYDFWWVVVVILGILAVVLGIILWKRRTSPALPEQQNLAVDNLDDYLGRIRAQLETLEEKAYYSEVAYFVRCVLERAYGFPAREMGSREIGEQMMVDQPIREVVLDVLKWCDRVKYARYTTSLEKRRQVLADLEAIYQKLFPSTEEKP